MYIFSPKVLNYIILVNQSSIESFSTLLEIFSKRANKWRNWLSSWEWVPNSIQISDSPSQSVLWKGKTCCKSIRCICNCCWLLWLGFPTFPRLVLQPWPRKQIRCTVRKRSMEVGDQRDYFVCSQDMSWYKCQGPYYFAIPVFLFRNLI